MAVAAEGMIVAVVAVAAVVAFVATVEVEKPTIAAAGKDVAGSHSRGADAFE